MQAHNGIVDGRRKGFFGSLFDLSFTSFITGGVVKFLYVVALLFAVLNALFTAGYLSLLLGAFLSSASDSPAAGIVAGAFVFLALAPVLTLFGMIYARVLLEIIVVLFRIAENTSQMAHGLRLLADNDRTGEASGEAIQPTSRR